MTAAEKSYVGLAKQSAKGTPNTTDADFEYILFNEGGMSPNNIWLPTDDEVGGGALQNDVDKVGILSAGGFNFNPRPSSIGHFLLGALGKSASPVADGTGYKHVFTLDTDQFAAPYWTLRQNVAAMWGEQFQDNRVGALVFNWAAANRVRAQAAITGGLPTPDVTMTGWGEDAKVDRGPTFLAAVTALTFPSETLKCLRGQVACGMNIPLDEQWITGSYSPDDFDINRRAFSVSMTLKITSKSIYNKIQYDPAEGAAWTADILKEGGVIVHFKSAQEYDTDKPYAIKFLFNESADNVAWSATPIALRAGRQVIMNITGTVLAVSSGEPIQVELYNDVSTQYSPVT